MHTVGVRDGKDLGQFEIRAKYEVQHYFAGLTITVVLCMVNLHTDNSELL